MPGQFRCKICNAVAGDALHKRDPDLKWHVSKHATLSICDRCHRVPIHEANRAAMENIAVEMVEKLKQSECLK
jgi:hypothetical protein